MSKFTLFATILFVSGLFFACDVPEEHNGSAPQDILSIKNGAVAPSNEIAPWVVRIEGYDWDNYELIDKWGHKCGGALIGEFWVLTAQHCTYNHADDPLDPSDMRVFVGEYSVLDEYDQVARIEVEEIIRHDGYVHLYPQFNDIALLKLSSAAPIGAPGVEKIAVFESTFQTAGTFPNGPIFGWGYYNPSSGTYVATDELRWAVFPGRQRSVCDADPVTSGFRSLADNEICLGYPDTTTDPGICKGDSGGPWVNWSLRRARVKGLPWTDGNGNIIEVDYMEAAVRGLVSWGTTQLCSPSYFVLIDVGPFAGWIANYVPDVSFET